MCGINTVELKKAYEEFCYGIKRAWVSNYYFDAKRSWKERISWLKEHGIPAGRESSDWWDADHIVPVIESGGECGPEGYRTLCIPCHKTETAKLRKRMSQRRMELKALPLLDA